MAQTLAIGLEKQNDQPTPSKALPKLSLSLSFSRGPHKVCGRGTVVPSRIITGGSPITGAPSLEGSPSRRTQKVHSDLLSSSLRSECPQPEPDPHGHRGGPGRQGKLASLSLDQSRLCTLSASICKGAYHLYMEEPGPWEAPLVECKEHFQRPSEGGGELPPETLKGGTCRSSSDGGVLDSPESLQPHPVLPKPPVPKREPLTSCPQLPLPCPSLPTGQSPFQK